MKQPKLKFLRSKLLIFTTIGLVFASALITTAIPRTQSAHTVDAQHTNDTVKSQTEGVSYKMQPLSAHKEAETQAPVSSQPTEDSPKPSTERVAAQPSADDSKAANTSDDKQKSLSCTLTGLTSLVISQTKQSSCR